jgi:hypothetical protein
MHNDEIQLFLYAGAYNRRHLDYLGPCAEKDADFHCIVGSWHFYKSLQKKKMSLPKLPQSFLIVLCTRRVQPRTKTHQLVYFIEFCPLSGILNNTEKTLNIYKQK